MTLRMRLVVLRVRLSGRGLIRRPFNFLMIRLKMIPLLLIMGGILRLDGSRRWRRLMGRRGRGVMTMALTVGRSESRSSIQIKRFLVLRSSVSSTDGPVKEG